jgi:hypothetical protein
MRGRIYKRGRAIALAVRHAIGTRPLMAVVAEAAHAQGLAQPLKGEGTERGHRGSATVTKLAISPLDGDLEGDSSQPTCCGNAQARESGREFYRDTNMYKPGRGAMRRSRDGAGYKSMKRLK